MAVLPILAWPDPRLARTCTPLEHGEDVTALVADMFDTMYAAPGRGLAGPQVGVMKRLFVIDVTWKEGDRSPVACLNPEIVAASGELSTAQEACLSIRGVAMPVARPARITLRWWDAAWQMHQQEMTGAWATCAQHELDHLDGTVIFDRVAAELRAGLEADYAAAKEASA
ncbi:peptide deformylase [Pseudooceanicola sp. 502str34]